MYGQTEATARLSIMNPDMLSKKLGSIGKGLRGTKLKLLDNGLSNTNPGEIGEIYAVGENIMLGYYKNQEETKKKIVHGMLKTGDMARIDEDGYFFVEGRISDFIKTRGYRVSGKLVENEIAKIPEIIDVAVIGVEDKIMGEKVVAFISSRSKVINEKYIKDWCYKNLRSHEIPSEIVMLGELPKNSSIKTDYIKLKKEYNSQKENA